MNPNGREDGKKQKQELKEVQMLANRKKLETIREVQKPGNSNCKVPQGALKWILEKTKKRTSKCIMVMCNQRGN